MVEDVERNNYELKNRYGHEHQKAPHQVKYAIRGLENT